MASASTDERIRYEPDERCPPLVAIGVGVQGALLALVPLAVVAAISGVAAGQDERQLTWTLVAALVVGGIVTILQAVRVGRVGLGHIMIMGVTPNYIAVSVLALAEGGPSTVASLLVLSSVFYFAVAAWLPQLRRVITPAVSGTVLMLIAVTLLPIAWDRLQEVSEGAPAFGGPGVAAVTLIATTILALRAPRQWRIWSPLAGIAAGCVAAVLLGLYDVGRVVDAPWFGLPDAGFPGLDLTPTAGFWALLPMFLVVTVVQAIKAVGDGVVVQQVAWRRPRATDFRLIQGTIYASALGTLLAGLAGTPPTSAFSASTVSLTNFTGVAARRVAYVVGIILVGLAVLPKLTGLMLTIPNPVMGGFLVTAVGMLFVEGVRTVARGGLDAPTTLVVSLAFAMGVGFEQHNVFEGVVPSPWSSLLGNGITVGAATAIGLTLFLELTKPKRRRFEGRLDMSDLPRLDAYLQETAAAMRWNAASTERLRSAGEETLSSLLRPADGEDEDKTPRLVVTASPEGRAVDLEFVAAVDEENLADRLAYLSDHDESPAEWDVSFRLLRHYASSVRHQKYHGIDVVTVRVDGSP
ncbi:MAG: hypothetical protein OXG43_01025 [Chloroflexi bacterium]|nr:hypothetical protein [Chloroflexota bacterium]